MIFPEVLCQLWSFLCSKVNQFWWVFHGFSTITCFLSWFFMVFPPGQDGKVIEKSHEPSRICAPGAGVVVANVSAMTVHRLMESFPQLVGQDAALGLVLKWATKDWCFTWWFWVNYNELTTSSLEIIVSKGNHPQMALIQVSELL